MPEMEIVYVISNPGMPGLVKIGRTANADTQVRLQQLYTSGVPFPFTLEFACRVPNSLEVERALHTAFAPHRVTPGREFFSINPGQAIAILRLMHVEDATAEIQAQPTLIDQQDVAAGASFSARRPNLNFLEMGIPIGAILTSTSTDASVVVVGPKRVTLNGEEMSITAATRLVLGLGYTVAPGPYWKYDGRLLREIHRETYPLSE
jgi:hypothetical protein